MNAGAVARRAVALALAGVVLWATPAAADAAKPGDYTSEVTTIEPDPGGFTIETAGGDSFLRLTVDEGTEVVVEGYQGEPYLRFNADGTVERNRNSPATYLNDARFGAGDLVPSELQGEDVVDLEPDWEQVATDGSYAWHDHRTHLMTPDPPVARGESFDWLGTVVLEVDGQRVEVSGRITYEDDVSPLPWYLLALVVAVALGVLGAKVDERVTAGLLAATASAALVVAWVGYSGQPDGTGASVFPVVVAAVAAVAGVVALAGRLVAAATLTSAVFLTTWAVFRISVLANPVLPTSVPFGLERLVTALALGVGVGAVVVAFRSGVLSGALAPLDDEADEAPPPAPAG